MKGLEWAEASYSPNYLSFYHKFSNDFIQNQKKGIEKVTDGGGMWVLFGLELMVVEQQNIGGLLKIGRKEEDKDMYLKPGEGEKNRSGGKKPWFAGKNRPRERKKEEEEDMNKYEGKWWKKKS
jgi:hypothetical protein